MPKIDTYNHRRQYTRPPFAVQDILDTFDYNPESGNLHYKGTPETVSAQKTLDGLFTKLGDKLVAVHRLCWCIHYKVWPAFRLRHLNGDKFDNRLSNLAQATPANDPSRCQAAATTAKPGW